MLTKKKMVMILCNMQLRKNIWRGLLTLELAQVCIRWEFLGRELGEGSRDIAARKSKGGLSKGEWAEIVEEEGPAGGEETHVGWVVKD